MSRITPIALSLALPITFMSQAALADLTPTDVWGDWKQYMQGMGYQVEATETPNGDDLTVADIRMNVVMPDDAGTMTMTLGTMSFEQNNDGTVSVIMPGIMPMALNIAPEGPQADSVTASLNYTQTGHSMLVSGSPQEMTYDYTAGTIELALEQLQIGADTFGAENAKMNVIGTGVNSSTTMTIAEMRGYQQTGKIDSLQYDVAINNPAEPAKVNMQGSILDMAIQGGGTIPLMIEDAADMAAMLKAGFDVTGEIAFGAGNTNIDVADPVNGNFALVSSSEGGKLGVEMGADGLTYTAVQNNSAITVNVADLPFPIDLSMATAGFNLSMPVSKSDDPQDFAFGINLGDFVMSDMIWGIFDPTSQLPRDPATIVLDLTGKAKLLVDFLDPDAAAQLAYATPGEVQALTVNKLQLDAAGAKLDGTGDFTFDNTDTTTFPGMPKPIGAVELSLAGGNGLLDKLVAMGILPDDQAMGARMMMGLFAVPGTEPDTLSSKVEFTEDGQVLANGQRIK